MPSNHLILCHSLLLLPSIFPSIRVFSNESALCIRWPKYCSFSFNISPSYKHSGLISFRMDWLDLLTVQTLKSLLQHHGSKASILRCSTFFVVQLSHPYMTTGKTIVLTRWTFVGKVMSLLFNMLSRLVVTFLPRSKHLLISCLWSPSAVILEPPKIKSCKRTYIRFESPSAHSSWGMNIFTFSHLPFWKIYPCTSPPDLHVTFPSLVCSFPVPDQLWGLINKHRSGTSLVVQWLRLCASNPKPAGGGGGLCSIPSQGTGSCMPQLRSSTVK